MFGSFCWAADVVMVPIVGACFILGSAVTGLLGRLTFNGEDVSYADEPLKFTGIVVGGVVIGLLCIGYGAIRFMFGHRTEG